MANFKTFPKVPQNVRNEPSFLREIMRIVNLLMDGKVNNTGEITLDNGQTSTVFADLNCSENSSVFLTPITADAAAVTGIYIQASTREFTVNHADPSSTDAKFRYAVVG